MLNDRTTLVSSLTRLAWILVAVAVVALSVAAVLGWRSHRFLQTAVPVEAEVVRVQRESTQIQSGPREGKTETHHTPTFRFQDGHGTSHTATTSHASTEYDFRVGQRVGILYDPTDPSRIGVDTFFAHWFAPLIAGGIGGMLGFFSLLLFGAAQKARERPPQKSGHGHGSRSET